MNNILYSILSIRIYSFNHNLVLYIIYLFILYKIIKV